MIRRPPRSTRTDTLFPYTTLFRSVRYDARSKTDLPPLITFIDGNRSNRNIERRIAAGIDPSHGAGICAAGVRLDFVDDLHRPQLRRACDRAAGKNRAEHVHWSDRKSTRLNSSH